jgi:hypothetical protein
MTTVVPVHQDTLNQPELHKLLERFDRTILASAALGITQRLESSLVDIVKDTADGISDAHRERVMEALSWCEVWNALESGSDLDDLVAATRAAAARNEEALQVQVNPAPRELALKGLLGFIEDLRPFFTVARPRMPLHDGSPIHAFEVVDRLKKGGLGDAELLDLITLLRGMLFDAAFSRQGFAVALLGFQAIPSSRSRLVLELKRGTELFNAAETAVQSHLTAALSVASSSSEFAECRSRIDAWWRTKLSEIGTVPYSSLNQLEQKALGAA